MCLFRVTDDTVITSVLRLETFYVASVGPLHISAPRFCSRVVVAGIES
jgi:hypothetical protein